MSNRRTVLDMAQVIGRFELAYRVSGRYLNVLQDRALRELRLCRTATLGGHVDICDRCWLERPAYNSCRNRHCPLCAGWPRALWYQQREAEMLACQYQHLVFTLPGQISRLAGANGALIYRLLFQVVSQVLLRYGRRHCQIQLGFICVLHSWGQRLNRHVHLHVLLPSGGLSLDAARWRELPTDRALPQDELMRDFRRRFLRRLNRCYRTNELTLVGEFASLQWEDIFTDWLTELRETTWIVHSELANRRGRSGQAADAGQALKYLARYASGVAIRNERLVAISDTHVTFSYKDYRRGGKRKLMKLPGVEFLRRFLRHVFPTRQFRHIRNYGFLSQPKRGKQLPLVRKLLGMPEPDEDNADSREAAADDGKNERRRCARCDTGRMVAGPEWPRPTIPEIMRMPLPGQRSQNQLSSRPRHPTQHFLPLKLHYLEYS